MVRVSEAGYSCCGNLLLLVFRPRMQWVQGFRFGTSCLCTHWLILSLKVTVAVIRTVLFMNGEVCHFGRRKSLRF